MTTRSEWEQLEAGGATRDLAKTDESLKTDLDALRSKYTDTPAIGGQPKGK